MKKINLKFAPLALVATMFVFAACSNDDDDKKDAPAENTELKGELTKDFTLKTGITYSLTGGYSVKSGATLTIEPGVIIKAKDDNIVDYILIEQGAKINAQGTKEKPIVMTAEKQSAGAWGGVHICGKAPINIGSAGKSEIGDAPYGGTVANDNSGIMKYVRVEYAGYNFSETKEGNGFTLYGVGSGTTLEYLQAYKGSDDGFEFFGGTVNVKHLVSTSNSDDSFDWTEGWQGKGQFLVAYQESKTTLGYDCDALIEADNYDKNVTATPVSQPTLANLTLVGNNSETNKRGIRLRAGTYVKIYNALVKGKGNNLTTETKETEEALKGGVNSILNNIIIEGDIKVDPLNFGYTSALFAGATGNKIGQTIALTNNYVGTIDGGTDLSADSFFEKALYKGAVSSTSDWTTGWTR